MRCNACMSLALFNRHTCRERAMEADCPICAEGLFSSALPVKELPCGHLMHSACFVAHTQHRYTCPVCARSVGDLALYFQMLDRLLLSETLPPELACRRQRVACHDCGAQSEVGYHYVYHKCPACASYNTRVL
jgi:zinc finger protein-like protein